MTSTRLSDPSDFSDAPLTSAPIRWLLQEGIITSADAAAIDSRDDIPALITHLRGNDRLGAAQARALLDMRHNALLAGSFYSRRLLRDGSSRRIHVARHIESGTPALLTIASDQVRLDPDARPHFAQLARLLRTTHSDLLPRCLDWQASDDELWMVTAHAKGRMLDHYIGMHGALPEACALAIAEELAGIIDHLHRLCERAHGALDPAAVLVCTHADERYPAHDAVFQVTLNDVGTGMPLSHPEPDIAALGRILSYLLTGTLPTTDCASDKADPRRLVPAISTTTATIVLNALGHGEPPLSSAAAMRRALVAASVQLEAGSGQRLLRKPLTAKVHAQTRQVARSARRKQEESTGFSRSREFRQRSPDLHLEADEDGSAFLPLPRRHLPDPTALEADADEAPEHIETVRRPKPQDDAGTITPVDPFEEAIRSQAGTISQAGNATAALRKARTDRQRQRTTAATRRPTMTHRISRTYRRHAALARPLQILLIAVILLVLALALLR